jgi:hypothetical protein
MEPRISAILLALAFFSLHPGLAAAGSTDLSYSLPVYGICDQLLTQAKGWDFSHELLKRFSGDITDYRKYALDQYGNEGFGEKHSKVLEVVEQRDRKALELYDFFRGLRPGFETLLIDPALVQRSKRFGEFISRNLQLVDPWEARKAFRESSSDVVVYRALALTPEELSIVKLAGLDSSQVRQDKQFPHSKEMALTFNRHDTWGHHFRGYVPNSFRSFGRMIQVHIRGFTNTPFISVSAYPEVASGVGAMFEKTLHIFKIHAKESDLVLIGPKNGLWEPVSYGESFHSMTLINGGKEVRVPLDDRIESLILFGAPPTAVEEIPVIPGAGYRFEN